MYNHPAILYEVDLKERKGRKEVGNRGERERERLLTVFPSAVSTPSTYTMKASSNDVERFR